MEHDPLSTAVRFYHRFQARAKVFARGLWWWIKQIIVQVVVSVLAGLLLALFLS